MSTCGLTYAHYREILLRAQDAGYEFSGFAAPSSGRSLLLRHDVDVDPFAALPMASLEQEVGVSATYFVRVRSPYYNILSAAVKDALAALRDLGADIQLHFDPAGMHGLPPHWVQAEIAAEADVLQTVLPGHRITCVSFHRPGSVEIQHNTGRLLSAYDPRFVHDMKYVSDSAGRWREGCACTHIGRHERLHLLTHPIWWGETSRSVPDAVAAFHSRHAARMDEWLGAEIRSYTPVLAAPTETYPTLSLPPRLSDRSVSGTAKPALPVAR
jgi:hypothetical protein